MREERRHKVHNQWPFILQLGAGHKCSWCRGCPCSVHQGFNDWVDANVEELGPELAEQFIP